MTSRRVEAAPLEYDAEEAAELFRMVEQPKNSAEAAGLEQFADEPYEEEEGEVEQALTEDAYSLLYTADFCSRTFFFACCVITLQGGMLLVTFFDLVDISSNPNQNNGRVNRMSIPQGATLTVTLAQGLGMVLTVLLMAAEGDIVVGFSQLVEGYDADVKVEMPNATFIRWLITGLLQMLIGIVLLLDSFILSMQSATVIDLVLNLTALYFLQEVDEIAFKLADMGIMSNRVQDDCEKVKSLKQFAPNSFTRRMLIWKRILLVLLTIGLLVPYAIVISWQLNGQFMCNTLHIQFGDAYEPELAYYSGRFDVVGYAFWDRKNERAVYWDTTRTLQMAYCNAEKAWTVSRDEPCNYIYKSSETQTFDVTEVANSPWFYKTEDTGDVEADWLKVVCIECGQTCKSQYGDCNKLEGTNLEYCECKEGRAGPTCELISGCDYFGIDERTIESLSTIPGASFFINNEFENLDNMIYSAEINLHDRDIYLPYQPYYWSQPIDENETLVNSFLLFTGRRWVIYSIPQEDAPNLTRREFIDFIASWWDDGAGARNPIELLRNITTELTQFYPLFFSSPVNYGGPSYGAEPSTVGWVLAQNLTNYTVISRRPDDEQPVSARLICTNCNEPAGRCQNDGICSGGTCYCSEYYEGHQCERAVDCVEYDGCYKDLGECNWLTKICDNCQNRSHGNLCQYGPSQLEDPFFCARCRSITLDVFESCDVELQQCNCSDTSLLAGEFCGFPDGWEQWTVAPTTEEEWGLANETFAPTTIDTNDTNDTTTINGTEFNATLRPRQLTSFHNVSSFQYNHDQWRQRKSGKKSKRAYNNFTLIH